MELVRISIIQTVDCDAKQMVQEFIVLLFIALMHTPIKLITLRRF